MSIQKELDIRDHPSRGLIVVEVKHNSAMRCANPRCSKELLYLREGSLQLLELESDASDQSRPDDGAFTMKPRRSKFFWLCGECSKTHIVKQWTTSGLALVLRNQKTAGGHPNLAAHPATVAMTRPLPASVVLPKPLAGHPLHPPASVVLGGNLLSPKAG